MPGKLLQSVRKGLSRIVGKLGPRARVILLVSFVASILIFALSVLRLFNVVGFEDFVESRVIEHMKNHVSNARFDKRKIKIILVPDKQQGDGPWGDIKKEHRKFFVDLITEMKKARAKVVAFDIAFEGPFDKEFSDAISMPSDYPRVIVGVDSYENGKTDPALPPDMKDSRWGLIFVGGSQQDSGPIRSMKLAEQSSGQDSLGRSESGVIPSLAVRVVSESYSPSLVPEFDSSQRRLDLYSNSARSKITKSIPLDRWQDLLLQQATQQDLNDARVSAQTIFDTLKRGEALRQEDYENRIVLVGYENGDLRSVLSGGQRLGVELHATAISNILHDVFIYKLSPLQNYIIILLMALVAGSLYTPFGKRLDFKVPIPVPWTGLTLPIPLSIIILIVLYLLVAFIVYKSMKTYLDVCYHVASLLASYGLVWFALKRRERQPEWENVR